MKVTVREFTRKFPNFRRAALAGKEVQVRDRAGNDFVFRATEKKSMSLAEAMGDMLGSVQSGRSRKTPAAYGRD
jgi:hypothetical protein